MTARTADLVGRAREMALLDRLIAEVAAGRTAAVVLVGEPGIGKTRLLTELIARTDAGGWLVLSGSATELEQDLPLSVFVDALDDYLRGLAPGRLSPLGGEVLTELAQLFPSLPPPAGAAQLTPQHERYRAHSAVRALLEQLARRTPLALVLDDFHWADSASVELLGALLRRPPAAPVLMALAVRAHQMPERLSLALAAAQRAGAARLLKVEALSAADTRALLGETVGSDDAQALHEESGGNPFYLEQLARSLRGRRETAALPEARLAGLAVPSAVAESLRAELAMLSDRARRVLYAAAVAGDPFEVDLAAAAAATSEAEAIAAVDELLKLDLVRDTDVPRRFRFRHPLVRRVIYEGTPSGWRLSAHERCGQTLAQRDVPAPELAHHVASSARVGDLAAVAVLRQAGEATARIAPASAARWFADALRLLPAAAPPDERIGLLVSRAAAQTAAGDLTASHATLLDALAAVPVDASQVRSDLVQRCAAVESALGQHEPARTRLVGALAEVPDHHSTQAAGLLIQLAMNGFWRSSYDSMRDYAQAAAEAGQDDGPTTAAALAVLALAESMTGEPDRAEAARTSAAALVDSVADAELARRIDAAAWLAGAELYLDRYADADAHAERALRVARATGQGELFLVLVQTLGRVWLVRGKLAAAADLLDGGIEAARLSWNRQALVWNLFNRSAVALTMGEVSTALATARESVDLARELGAGFHSAWAAVRLAEALLATGEPWKAADLLTGSAGGEDLVLIPGSWRAYCLELLTRCLLTLERGADAALAAARAADWAGAVRLPLAAAWAGRAQAAVALAAGDPVRAAELARGSALAADQVGAPVEAALARTLLGRALALSGQPDEAATELRLAAAAQQSCGALRHRDRAERELRRLGYVVHRRTRRGPPGGTGLDSLTERELQVARLIVDRKTNPEIAAELFLSQKTVETHLRNIFHKVGVSTRVDLARAMERAGQFPAGTPSPRPG